MPITFRADVKVPNVFKAAQLTTLVKQLQTFENAWAKDVADRAKKYPAAKPGSRYRRTNTFKRSVKVVPSRFEGQDLVVRVQSDAVDPGGFHYSRKLKGDDTGGGQAEIHAGRWPTFREDASKRDFAQGAQRVIDHFISGIVMQGSVKP